MKQIEFGVKYVWPLYKNIARGLSRRCKRCILSEKYTLIDRSDGLCKFCRNYRNEVDNNQIVDYNDVKDVISPYINFRHYYDALLLLSGGKDSAFILLKLREQLPHLRILCAIVDNGFVNPIAIKNVIQTTDQLYTDLIIISSFRYAFYGKLKRALLGLKREGCYSVVDYTDGYLIHDIGLDIAKRFNIKLMISGLSKAQLSCINNINDSFQISKDERAHQVFPLASWNENEEYIRSEVIKNKLIDKGNDSPIATNSLLVLPMCVLDIMRLGYVSFEPEFAKLVREGKADRKFWLNAFQWMEYYGRHKNYIQAANDILKPLNITIAQILGNNI